MSQKFHINAKGVPAPCHAKKGNCPFGGDESHYDSFDDAQAGADEKHSSEFGTIGNMPSNDFTTAGQEYNDFKHKVTDEMLESYFHKHGMHDEYNRVQADEEDYGNIANIVDNEDGDQDYFMFEQDIVGVVDYPGMENNGEKERKRLSNVVNAVNELNEAKGSKEEILATVDNKLTDSFIEDQFSSKKGVRDVGAPGEVAIAQRVFEYGAKKDKLYRLYDESPEYAKNKIVQDFMRDENVSDTEKHYMDNTDAVDEALNTVEEYYHSPNYGFDGSEDRVNKISNGLGQWLNGERGK